MMIERSKEEKTEEEGNNRSASPRVLEVLWR